MVRAWYYKPGSGDVGVMEFESDMDLKDWAAQQNRTEETVIVYVSELELCR